MTTIVNFFGGPSVGKTTLCAGTYFTLNKITKLRTEMALEAAKDEVWNGNIGSLDNQIHIFGEQLKRVWRLLGKIDVAVTDAPLLNSITYFKGGFDNFIPLIVEVFNSMTNLNFFIEREGTKEEYDCCGRYHTYEESIELDSKIKKILIDNKIPYTLIKKSDLDMVIEIVKNIVK